VKCIIFIFFTVENQTFRHLQKFAKQTYTNKVYFSTQRRFFPLFLLVAAKSSLLHWTYNFTLLLTSLTSVLPRGGSSD